MKSHRISNVTVHGGLPAERQLTTDRKTEGTLHNGTSAKRQIRAQVLSKKSRHGPRLRRVHVHPCCWLEPARLSPKTQPRDARRVRRRNESGLFVFHRSQRRGALHRLVSQLAGRGLRLQNSDQILQLQVGQGVVILPGYGENVKGEPAGAARDRDHQPPTGGTGNAAPRRRGQRSSVSFSALFVLVLVRGGVGAASQHETAHCSLTLNLAPHRSFGVVPHPAAVLVTPTARWCVLQGQAVNQRERKVQNPSTRETTEEGASTRQTAKKR